MAFYPKSNQTNAKKKTEQNRKCRRKNNPDLFQKFHRKNKSKSKMNEKRTNKVDLSINFTLELVFSKYSLFVNVERDSFFSNFKWNIIIHYGAFFLSLLSLSLFFPF